MVLVLHVGAPEREVDDVVEPSEEASGEVGGGLGKLVQACVEGGVDACMAGAGTRCVHRSLERLMRRAASAVDVSDQWEDGWVVACLHARTCASMRMRVRR